MRTISRSVSRPATRARINVTMRILNPCSPSAFVITTIPFILLMPLCPFSAFLLPLSLSLAIALSFTLYRALSFASTPAIVVNHNLLLCWLSLRGCIVFDIWRQLAAWFIVICFSSDFFPRIFPRIFHARLVLFNILHVPLTQCRRPRVRISFFFIIVVGFFSLPDDCVCRSFLIFILLYIFVVFAFDWNAFLWKICFLSIRQFNLDVIPSFVCEKGSGFVREYI